MFTTVLFPTTLSEAAPNKCPLHWVYQNFFWDWSHNFKSHIFNDYMCIIYGETIFNFNHPILFHKCSLNLKLFKYETKSTLFAIYLSTAVMKQTAILILILKSNVTKYRAIFNFICRILRYLAIWIPSIANQIIGAMIFYKTLL